MEILDSTLQVLREAASYFAEQQTPLYLVGGSLRNVLLSESSTDWDLATPGEAHKLARRLADRLGGFYAYLHEKASRVVVRVADTSAEIVLDIAPLRGEDIEEDLRARDFTLNAMAVPLGLILAQSVDMPAIEEVLIDPLGGLSDLRARRLRVVDEAVFRHDPLRMLRGLRLAKRYTLTLDSASGQLIQRDSTLLTSVAAERIHDELYKLLDGPGGLKQLKRLDEYGLLAVLIAEFAAARQMRQPLPHYWDVFEHSLQSVHFLEKLVMALEMDSHFPPELVSMPETSDDLLAIRELLFEAEQQGLLSLSELQAPRLKMAALLHDIGKPLTYTVDSQGAVHFYGHPQVGAPVAYEIARRLGASTADRRLAQMVAAHHMRPGQLSQEETITPRALRRYFVDLGPTGLIVALFSLADHLATLGPQPLTASWKRHLSTVRFLLTRYIREREKILPPRLVRADELMSRLKVTPGPLIGRLLEIIAEAQAEGRIFSREEAILLAKEYIREHVAQ